MTGKTKTLTDKEIGERMRAARERTHTPQHHISTVMTVSYRIKWHQTVVTKVENGERALKLTEAVAVAKILRIPLSELTGEEPSTKPEQASSLQIYELNRVQEQITKRLHELGA